MWTKVQNFCQHDQTFKFCGLYRYQANNNPLTFNWNSEKFPSASPIPLVSVKVNASVIHAVAEVEVIQIYINSEDQHQPIEAIYYFPVNPLGAVTHFQAELEGRLIKGEVKPHDEAKTIYDEAVENQRTSFLGEENNSDLFKISVGFLKPGTTVKITFGYVTEVKNDPVSNSLRFYIPARIQPFLSSKEAPAPFSLKADVFLQGGIKRIESPSHKIRILDENEENGDWQRVTLALDALVTEMDRDFILDIFPEEIHIPRLYSEKIEDGSTAVMLHFIPSFHLDEHRTELIFLLNPSGSSIELATKALLIFLRGLPTDCYFNIVGFGSNSEFLFPQSVKYDQASLAAALSHVINLNNSDLQSESKSKMGGGGCREIFKSFQAIYGIQPVEGYLRQIFLFVTDGHVDNFNKEEILGIVHAHSKNARVFSMGFGESPRSRALVEGVARAGGGTAAVLGLNLTENETIMEKTVLQQLQNALRPSLKDIEIEWIGEEMELSKMAPSRIPPIPNGGQLLVFGLFKDEIPSGVKVKIQSPDGPVTTIKIDYLEENDVFIATGHTGMLHHLAAVKLIQELELEYAALPYLDENMFQNVSKYRERLEELITEISCEYGVTSKFTCFVAVDNDADGDEENQSDSQEMKNCHWLMKTRTLPNRRVSFDGSSMFQMNPESQMQEQPLFGNVHSLLFGSTRAVLFASGMVSLGATGQQPQNSLEGFNFRNEPLPPLQRRKFLSSGSSSFRSTTSKIKSPFQFSGTSPIPTSSPTANSPRAAATTTSSMGQGQSFQNPKFRFAILAKTPPEFCGGLASFGKHRRWLLFWRRFIFEGKRNWPFSFL